MPHATGETPVTNGTKPSSRTISHLTSYPVVSDGIETFKSNPYGKKSIELADGAYTKFAKPVEPYLETPYNYAKPYLSKADELGDKGLDKVDGHFPIVKEETGTIVDTAKGYALWPFKLADDGKTYVLKTWSDEYEKTAKSSEGGFAPVVSVKALISTELKIASDFFHFVADIIGPKYDESRQKGADYIKAAQAKGEEYKQYGKDKFDSYTKFGQEKADEAQKVGEEKVSEAKSQAEGAKEETKKKVNGASASAGSK